MWSLFYNRSYILFKVLLLPLRCILAVSFDKLSLMEQNKNKTNIGSKPDMVVHASNQSAWEVKARGLSVWD